MANFKRKLQTLKEHTTSPEVKQFCDYVHNTQLLTPENHLKKLVVEGLAKLQGDAYSEEFVNRVKNDIQSDDLGLTEAYTELKAANITDPSYQYLLKAFEQHVNVGLPDYLAIDPVVENFKRYAYDPAVRNTVTKIQESADKFKTEIALKKVLFDLSKSQHSFMFENLQTRIQEYLETNKGKDVLMAEMMKLNYPGLQDAIRILSEAANKEGQLQFVNTNSSCLVESVISPVLFESDTTQIFTDRINFFKKTGNEVSKLTETEIKALPTSYLSLVEAFCNPTFKFTADSVNTSFGANKVKLEVETGKLFLNEKEATIESISKIALFTGDQKNLSQLSILAENRNLLFDMDFVKKISSKVYENAVVTVFKAGERLFANKLNGGMNENKFEEYSAINLNEMVKTFLNFEMNEGLETFLTAEKTELLKFVNEQTEIKEIINQLNDKLKVLEAKKVASPEYAEVVEKAEKAITEEIENLQAEWNDLEKKKLDSLKKETVPAE